jgi:hypothetical protein
MIYDNSPPITPPLNRFDDDDATPPTIWTAIGGNVVWLLTATVGDHGVLSHFPVMIVGILGIGAVMHRHWPSETKTLAGATLVGAVLIILLCKAAKIDWTLAMFAAKWFILFTPLLLFWSGAWLRRAHSQAGWILAGVALFFSVTVGLIGATDPTPPHGYDRYTAAGAMARLMQPHSMDGNALARREP